MNRIALPMLLLNIAAAIWLLELRVSAGYLFGCGLTTGVWLTIALHAVATEER